MGLQINLAKMLNLPKNKRCPKCNALIETGFDDFDIEAGNPNPKTGEWVFNMYCHQCNHEWKMKFQVTAINKD